MPTPTHLGSTRWKKNWFLWTTFFIKLSTYKNLATSNHIYLVSLPYSGWLSHYPSEILNQNYIKIESHVILTWPKWFNMHYQWQTNNLYKPYRLSEDLHLDAWIKLQSKWFNYIVKDSWNKSVCAPSCHKVPLTLLWGSQDVGQLTVHSIYHPPLLNPFPSTLQPTERYKNEWDCEEKQIKQWDCYQGMHIVLFGFYINNRW